LKLYRIFRLVDFFGFAVGQLIIVRIMRHICRITLSGLK
jgi:hypothetical protein